MVEEPESEIEAVFETPVEVSDVELDVIVEDSEGKLGENELVEEPDDVPLVETEFVPEVTVELDAVVELDVIVEGKVVEEPDAVVLPEVEIVVVRPEVIEDETDVVNELETVDDVVVGPGLRLEESDSEYEVLLLRLVVLEELPDDTRRRNIVPTLVASIRVPTLDFR